MQKTARVRVITESLPACCREAAEEKKTRSGGGKRRKAGRKKGCKWKVGRLKSRVAVETTVSPPPTPLALL